MFLSHEGKFQPNLVGDIRHARHFRDGQLKICAGDGCVRHAAEFRILINGDGQILLDPVVVMSEREVWLYKNPHALASVMQGLREAAAGEVHDLGTFAKDA